MGDVKWIKISTNIFDDEKILLIESLPKSDSILVIWFKLLCLAGKTNNSGVFLLNDAIPYTNEMLSKIFRRKKSLVENALKIFQEYGMIEVIDDVITIPQWGKHQNLDSIERKNEYMKAYMKEYREKQKVKVCKTNSKVNVSHTDKESDKEKEKDKYISSFSEFWKVYPRKQDKGQAYKCYQARLNDGYTEDQLLTACKNYADECQKNGTEQRFIKHGSTFLSVNEPFLDYLKGDSNDSMAGTSRTDEERRNAEIDEYLKRAEAGEFDHDDDGLWDGLP